MDRNHPAGGFESRRLRVQPEQKMLDLEEVGSQIRAHRQRMKLTQAELATISGVHLNTINGLERGVAGDIQAKTLLRIMNAVGLDLRVTLTPVDRQSKT